MPNQYFFVIDADSYGSGEGIGITREGNLTHGLKPHECRFSRRDDALGFLKLVERSGMKIYHKLSVVEVSS